MFLLSCILAVVVVVVVVVVAGGYHPGILIDLQLYLVWEVPKTIKVLYTYSCLVTLLISRLQ